MLAAAVSIAWIMSTRQMSMFADRWGTIEIDIDDVHDIVYEGDGNGGTLVVGNLRLNLDPADAQMAKPHVGTDKQNNLALSFGGKVFPFGPIQTTPENANTAIAAIPDRDDLTQFAIRHSAISWAEPFQLNFLSGHGASRKRHIYYQLLWKKSTGAKLELLWRFEQHLIPGNDWGSGFMMREGETGLIRVEISGPTQ